MATCPFCHIYYAARDNIFSDNGWCFAQYDHYPVSPGHTLIIPAPRPSGSHATSLFDLDPDEWSALRDALAYAVSYIEQDDLEQVYRHFVEEPLNERSVAFSQAMLTHPHLHDTPDGYNIGINEGGAAGRTIPHLHVHLMPRYHGDVPNPMGGIRHIFPEFGDYTEH